MISFVEHRGYARNEISNAPRLIAHLGTCLNLLQPNLHNYVYRYQKHYRLFHLCYDTAWLFLRLMMSVIIPEWRCFSKCRWCVVVETKQILTFFPSNDLFANKKTSFFNFEARTPGGVYFRRIIMSPNKFWCQNISSHLGLCKYLINILVVRGIQC